MTDTSSLPTPPAWLNLDLIVDEAFRAEAQTLADEVEAIIPTVRELAIRTFRLRAKYDNAVRANAMPDGVFDWLSPMVGIERLDALFRTIDEHVWGALLEGQEADWYAEEREKAGVPGGAPASREAAQ